MNGKDLLNGFTDVDEKLVEEAGKKKIRKSAMRVVLPVAASLIIFAGGVLFWQNSQKQIPSVAKVENSQTGKEYSLHFNGVANLAADNKLAIEGHFWDDISSEQKEKLLPIICKKYQMEGTVNYSHKDGRTSIYDIQTSIQTGKEKNISVIVAPNEVMKCYVIDDELVLSEIEGVKIAAGIFVTDANSRGERNYIYHADFKIDDVAYYVEYSGEKDDAEFFTSFIADIILGGKADLSVFDHPVVPELRDDKLSEEEVYEEADFGAYLIYVPNSYEFNESRRFINQCYNFLSASWSEGYHDIDVSVSKLEELDKARIVSAQDTELYDMSLYPIPWADSMPEDKRETIENPIFKIEDLTVDMLKMREYVRGESGDPSGNSVNLQFSVLYGDIVVRVSAEGVNAEYLFEELVKIPRT